MQLAFILLLVQCLLLPFFALSSPVLQGYDVVHYFQKDSKPKLGISSLSCRLLTYDLSGGDQVPYGVYEFWFSSPENVRLFEAHPWKYAPKYGGFDSWGIAHEAGPSWPWNKDSLGPPVHPWSDFSIYKEKLYLHLWSPSEFLDDAQVNVARADKRWIDWYGSLNAGPFNLDCQSDICRSLPHTRQDLSGMNSTTPEVQCSLNGFAHPLSELIKVTGTTQQQVFQLQRKTVQVDSGSLADGTSDGGLAQDEGQTPSDKDTQYVGSFLGSSGSPVRIDDISSASNNEMVEVRETQFNPQLIGKVTPLLKVPLDTEEFVHPAILGYDVVAYFDLLKEPVEGILGNPTYTCHLASYDKSHDEASLIGVYEFWFRNEENMEKFEENPWKYVPQYGGFCSWGIATELKLQGWPWDKDFLGPPAQPWNGWTVFDGKLYLNYWPSIAGSFFSNSEVNIRRANERWKKWWGAMDAGPINTHCPNAICVDEQQVIPPPCPRGAICKGKIPQIQCQVHETL